MTSEKTAPVLLPGKAIGPVHVGMARDEVAGLGLPVRPHPSGQMGDNVRLVGPYYVVFDGEKVGSVAFTLTGSGTGILVGEKVVPESASLEDVGRALPGCSAAEQLEGGTLIRCGEGTVIKRGTDGPEAIEIQVGAVGFLLP